MDPSERDRVVRAYEKSVFPELVEACHNWSYTLEDLEAQGLVGEEDDE